MIVWRVMRQKYAHDPLSGVGAARTGGRWNSKGVPVMYTGTTASLCAVELLANFLPTGQLPVDLVAAKIEIPDSIKISEPRLSDLPKNWNKSIRSSQCMAYGDRWGKRQRSMALIVLSATMTVAAGERNVILNPLHPDFSGVSVLDIEPLELDSRLHPKK